MRGKQSINILSSRRVRPPQISLPPESFPIREKDKTIYKKVNGKIHRIGKPAIIHDDGTEEWYKDGELHNEDAPALVHGSGKKEYWVQGHLHREKGPAIEEISGSGNYYHKEYWIKGKLHREDGPCKEINQKDRWYKEYKQNGEFHREDGPASVGEIQIKGGKEYYEAWYQHGKLHCKKAPAITTTTFDNSGRVLTKIEEWFYLNKKHREDGPSYVEEANFTSFNKTTEVYHTEGVHKKTIKKVNDKVVSELHYAQGEENFPVLHRTGAPAVKTTEVEAWFEDGVLHREDYPAFQKDGITVFAKENKLHNQEGPAIVIDLPEFKKEYYFIDGLPDTEDDVLDQKIINLLYQEEYLEDLDIL